MLFVLSKTFWLLIAVQILALFSPAKFCFVFLLSFRLGLKISEWLPAVASNFAFCFFLCPELRRSWRGTLLLGHSSVRPSVHHAF